MSRLFNNILGVLPFGPQDRDRNQIRQKHREAPVEVSQADIPDGGAKTTKALSREISEFLLEFSIGVHRSAMYPSDHINDLKAKTLQSEMVVRFTRLTISGDAETVRGKGLSGRIGVGQRDDGLAPRKKKGGVLAQIDISFEP